MTPSSLKHMGIFLYVFFQFLSIATSNILQHLPATKLCACNAQEITFFFFCSLNLHFSSFLLQGNFSLLRRICVPVSMCSVLDLLEFNGKFIYHFLLVVCSTTEIRRTQLTTYVLSSLFFGTIDERPKPRN